MFRLPSLLMSLTLLVPLGPHRQSVTSHEDVAPITHGNCTGCHREGKIDLVTGSDILLFLGLYSSPCE